MNSMNRIYFFRIQIPSSPNLEIIGTISTNLDPFQDDFLDQIKNILIEKYAPKFPQQTNKIFELNITTLNFIAEDGNEEQNNLFAENARLREELKILHKKKDNLLLLEFALLATTLGALQCWY